MAMERITNQKVLAYELNVELKPIWLRIGRNYERTNLTEFTSTKADQGAKGRIQALYRVSWYTSMMVGMDRVH